MGAVKMRRCRRSDDLLERQSLTPGTSSQGLRVAVYAVKLFAACQYRRRKSDVSGFIYVILPQHTTHKFNNGNQDTFYPFVINDTMGLSNNCSRSNRNNHVRDIEKALKGHVSEGYTFNPECRLSMDNPFLNLKPSANDKVHVLVFVIDANKFSQMIEKAVETFQDIREEAIRLDIPQVVLLTKIDEFCPESQQDVKNVYKSKRLKEKMKEVSARVGIPVNCIFPVKNYSEEMDLNSDTDALILSALKHILQLGNDHLNNHYA